jgi:hypothetical protein
MSIDALDYRTVRHELNIADAVLHCGLVTVLRLALRARLNHRQVPADLPDRLRRDMGLPPAPRSIFSFEPTEDAPVPLPMWLPRM